MSDIFISYATPDYDYALRLQSVLAQQGYSVWFAPKSIASGRSFTEEIAGALAGGDGAPRATSAAPAQADGAARRFEELSAARMLVLVLSAQTDRSKWVPRELCLAIEADLPIRVARVDDAPLSGSLRFCLTGVQADDVFHLNNGELKPFVEKLRRDLPPARPVMAPEAPRIDEAETGILGICRGDTAFREDATLFLRLTDDEFYLAPPASLSGDAEAQACLAEHRFAARDHVFGGTLQEALAAVPIPDLAARVERSREKVFLEFVRQENGRYFNNKKYGVERVNPFMRSEDGVECSQLTLWLYTTDYFTHRVMKDVCKQLTAEGNTYLSGINYARLGPARIFFTSLGLNLILLEDELRDSFCALVATRSTNAAETNGEYRYSLSVIEGVSLSDYDAYMGKVRLALAAERGLKEELGVTPEMIAPQSLAFHDFFVNRQNLEMGISCTVSLRRGLTIEGDVLPLHGRDEALEVADKRAVPVVTLPDFVRNNQSRLLPQALFVWCEYLESRSVRMLNRSRRRALGRESAVFPKDGSSGPCGDAIVETRHFLAVIDGATPKGELLWEGQRGDVFVAQLLAQAVKALPPDIAAADAIARLNRAVFETCAAHGVDFETLPPPERLQASVLLYSVARREVWTFGDCMLRINQQNYNHIKKGDQMLADLRAFCVEAAALEGLDTRGEADYGRTQILPFLRRYTRFANAEGSFAYDVINGGDIHPERVMVYTALPGDHIVLASDGYPRLFDTLEETENYLAQCLRSDPMCVGALRGTKGVRPGDVSFDDRSYLSFIVE